jgi:hypothetical protein
MAVVPSRTLVGSNPRKACRILNGLVEDSVTQRRNGQVPSLAASGVRYRREPRGIDRWLTALETFQQGYGDCEDLAVWAAADQVLLGRRAEVCIKAIRPGLSHAVVLVNGKTVLDPSRFLGMRGAG